MSTNCLVTKLKSSVNNSELPVLNAIKFYIGNTMNSMYLAATSGNTITFKTADGSAKIATSEENRNNGIFVSSVNVTGTTLKRFWFSNPNCYFIVTNKDKISAFQNCNVNDYSTAPIIINTKELSYTPAITTVMLQASSIQGDIANLNTCGNTQLPYFKDCTFIDDVDFAKFGYMYNLSKNVEGASTARGTNLKGSIEKFVANYRKSHTATSGSISFINMYSGEKAVITFNGSKIGALATKTTWSWVANEQDSTMTDITSPNGALTITIDADGNKISE